MGTGSPCRRATGLAALVAVAAAAAACGQWSGAPVSDPWQGPVPLGPGPTKTLARGVEAVALATDAWGPTLVVVWAQRDEASDSLLVRAATSADAGSSFAPPVVVGSLTGSPRRPDLQLRVGVTAPAQPGTRGAEQVWVRLSGDGGPPLAPPWRSQDAGRRFAAMEPDQHVPDSAFPGRWVPATGTSAAPGTRLLSPPGPLRYAGVQRVPLPAGAAGDPEVVVDDHGALALAWRERGEPGTDALTVRRAWVDWNATGGAAPAFDATYRLAALGPHATGPAIARLPGGVAVAWSDLGPDGVASVLVRRLGLDMTCTRESAEPGSP
jgi:hypothetical protein